MQTMQRIVDTPALISSLVATMYWEHSTGSVSDELDFSVTCADRRSEPDLIVENGVLIV